jgi:hypothetical protein
LKKLVETDFIEIPTSPTDYGYALSNDGIIKVKDEIEEINGNITAHTLTIFGKLSKAQREKMEIQEDFDYYTSFISEEFAAFNETFSDVKERGENLTPKADGTKGRNAVYEDFVGCMKHVLYPIGLEAFYKEWFDDNWEATFGLDRYVIKYGKSGGVGGKGGDGGGRGLGGFPGDIQEFFTTWRISTNHH